MIRDGEHGDAAEPFAETVTRFRRTRRELTGLREQLPVDPRVGGYRRDDTRRDPRLRNVDAPRRHRARARSRPVPANGRGHAHHGRARDEVVAVGVSVRGSARPGITARIVLEGAGGGEWTVPCAPGETPSADADVVVRASVVDWCRRFADRIEPDDVAVSVDGDPDLARELVCAANAFAGL